jgi:pyruvate,water dikinase
MAMEDRDPYIVWFSDPESADVAKVGGKNASLGEMTQKLHGAGIDVPDGFAINVAAYWSFIEASGLQEKIAAALAEYKRGGRSLAEVGQAIRTEFLNGELPAAVVEAVTSAYRELSFRARRTRLDVAVRSSATAEYLAGASFAGQLESFLNVRGEQALLQACRRCFASLFTDRAIVYRETNGFDHLRVAVSVGVQANDPSRPSRRRGDVLHRYRDRQQARSRDPLPAGGGRKKDTAGRALGMRGVVSGTPRTAGAGS